MEITEEELRKLVAEKVDKVTAKTASMERLLKWYTAQQEVERLVMKQAEGK